MPAVSAFNENALVWNVTAALSHGVLGREPDCVQEPIEPPPAPLQVGRHGRDVGVVVDVHLQHVRHGVEPARDPLGQAHRPPHPGQHDLGPRLLGNPRT
jgi:hypothetical protein